MRTELVTKKRAIRLDNFDRIVAPILLGLLQAVASRLVPAVPTGFIRGFPKCQDCRPILSVQLGPGVDDALQFAVKMRCMARWALALPCFPRVFGGCSTPRVGNRLPWKMLRKPKKTQEIPGVFRLVRVRRLLRAALYFALFWG